MKEEGRNRFITLVRQEKWSPALPSVVVEMGKVGSLSFSLLGCDASPEVEGDGTIAKIERERKNEKEREKKKDREREGAGATRDAHTHPET